MTDKQIIIDGVDVSGCWYIDRDNAWCDLCMTSCVKGTKHCYYKQLKAKEQECEELKQQFKIAEPLYQACNIKDKKIDHLKEQLEAYKMEAEEGKEINAELKAENETLKSFDINLVGIKECEIRQLVQYRKALTEIKEIAENAIKNVSDRCIETTPMYGVHKQILQKISECEVGSA